MFFRRARSRKKLWELADRHGWDVEARGDELRVRWESGPLRFEASNFYVVVRRAEVGR